MSDEDLIAEARRWAEHEGLGALVKRLIRRLADALSSALRERDGPPVDRHGAWPLELREAIEALEEKWDIELIPGSDHGRLWRDREHFRKRAEAAERERDMIAAVNADWSAYDKGLREAGKAVVASALASPVNRISADMQQFWDAVQALRSALSLVPESKDNGS